MYNRTELKAIIARFDDTQTKLAKALNTTPAIMSAKITGRTDFKRKDIEEIAIRYELEADDVWRIFFAPDVNFKETQ